MCTHQGDRMEPATLTPSLHPCLAVGTAETGHWLLWAAPQDQLLARSTISNPARSAVMRKQLQD